MKKIIFIKTIQLLIIDGIMLAFLTFKGGLVPMATISNEKHRTPLLIYYEKQKALFSFSFLKYLIRWL